MPVLPSSLCHDQTEDTRQTLLLLLRLHCSLSLSSWVLVRILQIRLHIQFLWEASWTIKRTILLTPEFFVFILAHHVGCGVLRLLMILFLVLSSAGSFVFLCEGHWAFSRESALYKFSYCYYCGNPICAAGSYKDFLLGDYVWPGYRGFSSDICFGRSVLSAWFLLISCSFLSQDRSSTASAIINFVVLLKTFELQISVSISKA